MESLVSFVSLMLKEFILKMPMLFLLMLIFPTYIPAVPGWLMGQRMFDLELNLGIIKFPYAGIPIGLTIGWAIYVPVYYFYVRPTWRRIDEEAIEKRNKSLSEGLRRPIIHDGGRGI